MSKENRNTFIKGMNLVLPYIRNKEIFMSNLKFSVKSNWCRQLDYDCFIHDFMATCDLECILTDKGYEQIKNKYEKEIQEFKCEYTLDCEENT